MDFSTLGLVVGLIAILALFVLWFSRAGAGGAARLRARAPAAAVTAALALFALSLSGSGCAAVSEVLGGPLATPEVEWVKADRLTFEVVAPSFYEYVVADSDPGLATWDQGIYDLLSDWEFRIRSAEGALGLEQPAIVRFPPREPAPAGAPATPTDLPALETP